MLGAALVAHVVALGNPACWRGAYSYELCCRGDSTCWDRIYTADRCCHEHNASAAVDVTGQIFREITAAEDTVDDAQVCAGKEDLVPT